MVATVTAGITPAGMGRGGTGAAIDGGTVTDGAGPTAGTAGVCRVTVIIDRLGVHTIGRLTSDGPEGLVRAALVPAAVGRVVVVVCGPAAAVDRVVVVCDPAVAAADPAAAAAVVADPAVAAVAAVVVAERALEHAREPGFRPGFSRASRPAVIIELRFAP